MELHEHRLPLLHTLWDQVVNDWPAEAHWFCPKRYDDDLLDYDGLHAHDGEVEEDQATPAQKMRLIEEGNERLKIAYKIFELYLFDVVDMGDVLADAKMKHRRRSLELLTTCDYCVRNFHKNRKHFLKEFSEYSPDERVKELATHLNNLDFMRIDQGLEKARDILINLPPKERSPKALMANAPALTAMYEALCSPPYHKSEEKLRSNFDEPFKLVQERRILKLGDILPAMTRFLFVTDNTRLRFARSAWHDVDRKLTKERFDWAIHDALTDAIMSVSLPDTPESEVEHFYEGILMILNKFDADLITHSLRAMEVSPDLYHLVLLHLSRPYSAVILSDIIKTLLVLLLKSPKDFYAAYDALSATTLAEQIFGNSKFEELLESSQHHELIGENEVPSALAWIPPFVQSLPAAHQYEICRSLLYHLFERFQDRNLAKSSKIACFKAGLSALVTTLITFVDAGYKINAPTPFIVINNVLGLVDQYRLIIVDCANLGSSTNDDKELSRLGMQVIRNALSLCCKSILAEFEALSSNEDIRHGLDSHSQSIWIAVLDGFRRDNIEMATNILNGLHPLVGLDQLKPRSRGAKGVSGEDPLLKCKIRFNREFSQIIEINSRFFERLSDFTPKSLQALCKNAGTAYSVFAGLTPPEQAIYEATVEVIKAITGESARRDAMARLLRDSLSVTLRSLAWAANRISRYATFGGIPYLLKTSRDVLDSLCSSENGLLRTKLSPSKEEQTMIMAWWKEQWRALSTVFQNYENWAYGATNINYMTDICRDIMDYAEALFDQYVVLASIMDESNFLTDSRKAQAELSRASRKSLLEHPRKTMQYTVGWLRLKDPYLLSTLVSLVCKVLRRLGEFDMSIDEKALSEVEKLANGGFRNYRVTDQQRAELLSALEDHNGFKIVTESKRINDSKHGAIGALFKSSDQLHKEIPLTTSKSPLSTINDGVRALSKSLEQGKPILDQIRARQAGKAADGQGTKKNPNATMSLKESREKAKEEKRKRDASYLAEVHALRAPSGLVTGEGSGLKDIGVQGKDHGPALEDQGVMISDDELSEDDGSDVKALLVESKDKAKKVSEKEKLKRMLLQEPQGPVRKTKIHRSANDMRARLIPNMDKLHSAILCWDIFHEGDEPPSNINFQGVSNTFRTPDDYYNTFHPLLIAEAWRSLSTAKEESNYKPFDIKVINRLSIDTFFEVGTSMQITDNRDNNLAEGDIVLLSKSDAPLRDREKVLCLARTHRTTRKKDVLEVSYRISGIQPAGSAVLSALSPNLKIRGLKITSMTTIEREYAALKSLQYYDLCDEILSAKPSPLLSYPSQTFNQVKAIYGVNEAQAKAIWSARDNDAFTLIQGPPGSGKTKTIVAMVGALLTDKLIAPGVPITHPRGGDTKIQPGTPVHKKLLICAPSNAAVDELVTRLKQGVKTLKGEFQKIKVIRLGRSEAINSNVKDVTLDELVRAKMEGDSKAKSLVLSERELLHQQAARLKEAVDALRPKLDEARDSGNVELERRLQREFDGKKRDQARIGTKIEDDKANGNTASRENEITRRKLQQEIIDSAHVLCATLSGSGHDLFRNLSVEFETVIIDEAAQCIELSALIPLKYGCSKCILVGDPKQLPPTVLSKSAARYGYEQSLFVRMQQNHPSDVHLLDVQYRMHPEISKFPSYQFYDGRLIDGKGLADLRDRPWHSSGLLGPYRFFDIKGTQSNGTRGHSFINMEEVSCALRLYKRLTSNHQSYDFRGKIGVITPYKAQLKELRQAFQRSYGEDIIRDIDFNTTDAFQGRESEVIIFSCVRARASGGIGFLEDIRRMNVGLTRAKSSLWILGDSRSLVQGQFWAKLIEDAKNRQLYSEGMMDLVKEPREGSVSAQMSRRDSTDTNQVGSPADIEMTDAPTSRRASVSSEGKAIVLDELNTSIVRDNGMSSDDTLGAYSTLNDNHIESARGSKHTLSASPTTNEGPETKKIMHSKSEAQIAEASSRLREVSATVSSNKPSPKQETPGQQVVAHSVPHRRPMLVNVPPPRKKAPADPLIRNRGPKRP